jgi:FAD/FMN-containing dehydrogenase
MVWSDVSFRTISHIAMNDPNSALRNTLVAEQIINGYVANQVLAIRRLLDSGRGVISLRRLLIDIRSNFHLFTRENCVCYDGLPYDYEAIREKDYASRAGPPGKPVVFWVATKGPDGWGGSQAAHRHFDKMAGVLPQKRTREDRLHPSLLDAVESWLEHTDANALADWSHAYLAHAGNFASRQRIKDAEVTNIKITEAIKCIARATEALSADILYHAGRTNALMPTPQFDQFEGLDQPLMKPEADDEARELWRSLTQERDASLGGVTSDLIAYRDSKAKPTGE